MSDDAGLTKSQTLLMMFSVFTVALCGIAYELIIAAVSTYLLGNSVYQFSITVGLFMFAMGIGSYLSKWVTTRLVDRFILVEIIVAFVGGVSSSLLFVFFPYVAFYRPVMYGLILVIGTLVGLEIPLLTRILSRSNEWKEAIANVLSVDYLGALVGSVALPILLLPSLGLFRSSFVIGLLNAVVALAAIVMFRRTLAKSRSLLLGAIGVVLALLGGLASSVQITQFAEGQLYADTVLYRQHTPYQRIIVTKNEQNDEIRLYLDGHLQFASKDEYRYHEALVHPVMSLPGPRERVLVLGGGDGIAIRELVKYPEVQHVDLVDIDPAMIELCRTFEPIARVNEHAFDNELVTVITADAYRYVIDYSRRVEAGESTYDRVIIDLPDPHNEVLDKLYSKEFYQLVRSILTPKTGGFVTQSSSPLVTRDAYWCIGETVAAADFDVTSYHASLNSFGLWGFHLGVVNGPPAIVIDETKTKSLTTATFQASTTFSQDTARTEVPVNRTFEPKLYTMYVKQLRL